MDDERLNNTQNIENDLGEQPDYDFKTFVIHTAKYKTLLTKKFINRKAYQPPEPGKVTAFIPGTIRKIMVKENKSVRKGQNLLVLEAMKMNNQLNAPVDGKIVKIHVAEGDRVSKDQILIEIE